MSACISVSASAQTQQDVVYLKNGSVIRGLIIETVPNTSLKVQTPDGSLFVCGFAEIEKITKESPTRHDIITDNDISDPEYRTPKTSDLKKKNEDLNSAISEDNGIKTGFRGYYDIGYGLGVSDNYEDNRLEISMSCGWQFSPYFYTGIGAGAQYWFDSELYQIPIFGHLRSDFINKKNSPFIDLKIGYMVYDGTGLFVNPSIGYRFGDIHVALGYTYNQFEFEYDDYYDETIDIGSISIKLGCVF